MGDGKLNFNAPFLSMRRFPTVSIRSKESNENRGDKQGVSHKSDASLEKVTAVTIPFMWEQIPGRAMNNEVTLGPNSSEERCSAPNLQPANLIDRENHPLENTSEERKTGSTSGPVRVSSESLIRLQSSRDIPKEEGVSDSEDEEFCDALETLSLSDSFAANHRVSGVSGFDNHVPKQTETSADPQTPNFMMSRFLPAAKAMVLKQPHYASKKQLVQVVPDQPIRQTKKVVSVKRESNVTLYESIVRRHYLQDMIEDESDEGDEDEGDEDERDGYGMAGNDVSRRGCGLLPQFCLRNSLGMLHAAPGLKLKASASVYSSHALGKPNKASRIKSFAQTVKKLPHAFDSVHKPRPNNRAQSRSVTVNGNKLSCESSWLTTNPGRSSPLRHSVPSSYRNASVRSPVREFGLRGPVKDAENLRAKRLNKHIKSQELLFPKSTRQSSDPPGSAAKKTLFIDTVPDSKVGEDSVFRNVKGGETLRSLLDDANEASKEVDTISSSLDQERGQDMESVELSNVNSDIKTDDDSIGDQVPKHDTGKSTAGFELSVLSPPLPKTPSDSWLSRNLTSAASRNPSPFLRSRASPRKQRPEKFSAKWEIIVKTSYSKHDHVRHSKELITHFSPQP